LAILPTFPEPMLLHIS